MLMLYDGKKRLIAQAPVGEVWAHKARFPIKGLQLNVDGSRYTLDRAPSGVTAFGIGASIRSTGELIDVFLRWFPDHGGNAGRPT